VAALSRAEAQFASLAGTAFIQVDYAAQFESERARTATCARMERHNFEVCHAGFSPYVQAAREGRFRNKRPRERFVYKQQVYVFFAFSNAGYKPNARSHNIVQEDIAHFLKYGTFLHGEWFEGGERYPGGPTGDARQPLPGALSEAAPAPPVLPGMDRQVEVSDGCGSQYDSGTQHHQTAEWRTKTANWPEAREAATAAAAEMAAATTEAERAAAAARRRRRSGPGAAGVAAARRRCRGRPPRLSRGPSYPPRGWRPPERWRGPIRRQPCPARARARRAVERLAQGWVRGVGIGG
jgi:hypothetical protein